MNRVGKCERNETEYSFLEEESEVLVTSTKGKLQKRYEQFDRVSVDSDFYFKWKDAIERKVSMCSSLSEVCEDETLDGE